MLQKSLLAAVAVATLASGLAACGAPPARPTVAASAPPAGTLPTRTPIKHLVVIYQENVSFDHYFATYPVASNPPGEPAFTAAPGTPAVNNLVTAGLLVSNPNSTAPFRLDRSQASTADQEHAYTAEQRAYHGGKADRFPEFTGAASSGGVGAFGTTGQVMGYFDGNTVTALWNYAQHFALSDHTYTDTYGPSTPGALEVVSGQTNGMQIVATTKQPFTTGKYSYYVNDGQGGYTMINDVDPGHDACSSPRDQALMSGRNIGELLSAHDISWGGFMGGFNLQTVNPNGSTGCHRSTYSTVVGATVADYIPHHNWFQYYAATANPTHARPSAVAAIGQTYEADGTTPDPAHHQYGLQDFFAAVRAGHFPAVSYLKAPAFEDGHAGYSDPLDEQAFVTRVVNFLQRQPQWKDTAIIVAWDDSDGWYDHAFAATSNPSFDPQADQLDGPGICGKPGSTPLDGVAGKPVNGRCGPGTRVPLLLISPWARANYVSHVPLTQASVVRFIEDNWLDGQRLGGGSFDASAGSLLDLFDFAGAGDNPPLYLDGASGSVLSAAPPGPAAAGKH